MSDKSNNDFWKIIQAQIQVFNLERESELLTDLLKSLDELEDGGGHNFEPPFPTAHRQGVLNVLLRRFEDVINIIDDSQDAIVSPCKSILFVRNSEKASYSKQLATMKKVDEHVNYHCRGKTKIIIFYGTLNLYLWNQDRKRFINNLVILYPNYDYKQILNPY